MKYTITINQNSYFALAYKKGKFVAGKNIVFYFRKNNKKIRRLGISTSKKMGNAVQRSRARRIIRQAYYEMEEILPVGYDYIITARPGIVDAKSYNIKSFIEKRVLPAMKCEKNVT